MHSPAARPLPLLVLPALLAACDEPRLLARTDSPDAGSAGDAGEDAGRLPETTLPTPPEPPALPRLADWDCPDGWLQETAGEGEPWSFRLCRPPEVPECEPPLVAFLGETACRRLGPPCPEDGLADEGAVQAVAPGFEGPVVHVAPAGSATPDGSRGAPFARIGEALRHAAPGGVVALAAGTYREVVVLDGRVALVGACVGGTVVEAPGDDELTPTIGVEGDGDVVVANLTVRGGGPGVGVVATDNPATLRNLVVDGGVGAGVYLIERSAGATLEDVVIRGVRVARTEWGGWGLLAAEDAAVEVRRALFLDNARAGLLAADGRADWWSQIDAYDVVVRRSGVGSGAAGSGAVEAISGGVVTLERALVDGTSGWGLAVGSSPEEDATSKLDAVALVVRGSVPAPGRPHGGGLLLERGGYANLERCLFESAGDTGLAVDDAGGALPAEVELEDVVVRGTAASPAGEPGWALAVLGGAAGTLSRVLIEDNVGVSLVAAGPETGPASTLEIKDVVVRRTRRLRGEDYGWGLVVEGGAEARGRRLLVDESGDAGIHAVGRVSLPQTELVLEDVTVRGSGEGPDPSLGIGVAACHGASLSLTRALVEQSWAAGVEGFGFQSEEPTLLALADVVVRGTRGRDRSKPGRGLELTGRVSGRLERVLLEENHQVGLMLGGLDPGRSPRLEAEDLTVRETQSLPDARGGWGLAVQGGAALSGKRLLVEGNERISVAVLGRKPQEWVPTSLDVEDLTILDTAVAPCATLPPGSPTSCREAGGRHWGGGVGLVAAWGGGAQVRRLAVRGSALAGLVLGDGGRIEVRSGTIRDNATGVNAPAGAAAAGGPLDLEDVYIFDNQVDVAAQELTLPSPREAVLPPERMGTGGRREDDGP